MAFRTKLAIVALGLALVGCTGPAATPSQTGPAAPTESKTLTVLTHDSFALDQKTLDAFAQQTGYQVQYVAPGDAGTLVNQLILTKDAPLGDVVFGIDNTFASRAIEAGVLSPYAAPDLPAGTEALAADATNSLTPIDYGDVCLNADTEWFADHDLAVPQTLGELAEPEYRDLLVVENPASSSPGMAFLAATVGVFGVDGYLDYWSALKANGVKVVKGWTEAYTVEFSGSSGEGSRPLVVSYSSSPAFEHDTQALPKTCFRQVEYAGVLAGAQNQVGAQKFIDFLLTADVQAQIPDQMYMAPVDPEVELPADWREYVPTVSDPIKVDTAELGSNRDAWIKAWTATVIG